MIRNLLLVLPLAACGGPTHHPVVIDAPETPDTPSVSCKALPDYGTPTPTNTAKA